MPTITTAAGQRVFKTSVQPGTNGLEWHQTHYVTPKSGEPSAPQWSGLEGKRRGRTRNGGQRSAKFRRVESGVDEIWYSFERRPHWEYDVEYHSSLPGGSKKRVSVYLGSLLLAEVTEDGTGQSEIHYSLTDHLGSSSITTNATGTPEQIQTYYAFGSPRITSGQFSPRHTYTGKEKDVESSLLYYGARYYSSDSGKFTSQDPLQYRPWDLVQSGWLSMPQALNFYSYTANNPIKYTDPTGESLCFEATTECIESMEKDIEIFDRIADFLTGGRWSDAKKRAETAGQQIANQGATAANVANAAAQVIVGAAEVVAPAAAEGALAGVSRGASVGTTPVKSVLQSHFEKHGAELGAKNLDEYIKMAENLIKSKGESTFTYMEKGRTLYFDYVTGQLAIVEDNIIKSFYKVTDPDKLRHAFSQILNQVRNAR